MFDTAEMAGYECGFLPRRSQGVSGPCRRGAGFGHYGVPPSGIWEPLCAVTRSKRAGLETTGQLGGEDAQQQMRVPVKRVLVPNVLIVGEESVKNIRHKKRQRPAGMRALAFLGLTILWRGHTARSGTPHFLRV